MTGQVYRRGCLQPDGAATPDDTASPETNVRGLSVDRRLMGPGTGPSRMDRYLGVSLPCLGASPDMTLISVCQHIYQHLTQHVEGDISEWTASNPA
jgi:hypothetical protein